jgi:hypothetical protein
MPMITRSPAPQFDGYSHVVYGRPGWPSACVWLVPCLTREE